ncbi:hypothetical protein UFOVP51_24 [uncultured Caudovirales phage]|uniref:Uncharacterized protein n=1 Tax=uncultured Caudovirales phage TaxID=2100421 RepID=A0A6J5T8M5_9CAUD|nr:hypothetical protein UFOVP51_24 [uncultured Caudovirales phage]CAB4241116.1 hypothetical protein UFOVP34_82 [uncultured Caudovirales phage]
MKDGEEGVLYKVIIAFLWGIFLTCLIASFKLCNLWLKLRYHTTMPKEWLEDAKKHLSWDKIKNELDI